MKTTNYILIIYNIDYKIYIYIYIYIYIFFLLINIINLLYHYYN